MIQAAFIISCPNSRHIKDYMAGKQVYQKYFFDFFF